MAEAEKAEYRAQLHTAKPNTVETALFKGTDFEKQTKAGEPDKGDLFNDAPEIDATSDGASKARSITSSNLTKSVTGLGSILSGSTQKAETAFEDAGLKKPCKWSDIAMTRK
jgi:hypothetical protein